DQDSARRDPFREESRALHQKLDQRPATVLPAAADSGPAGKVEQPLLSRQPERGRGTFLDPTRPSALFHRTSRQSRDEPLRSELQDVDRSFSQVMFTDAR